MSLMPRPSKLGRLTTALQPSRSLKRSVLAPVLALSGLLVFGQAGPAAKKHEKNHEQRIEFNMVRNGGLPAVCLPFARGEVEITSKGPVEVMEVEVEGLPPNTEFDFFVIQKPGGPFGMSWYQGDIETDDEGEGHGKFIGRFNIETFIVAPGSVPAPQPHDIRDASSNPVTLPVHTFHLGLWFNSPADASQAGCGSGMTPFNGDHTAGVQVLNTSNFPDLAGPLSQLQ